MLKHSDQNLANEQSNENVGTYGSGLPSTYPGNFSMLPASYGANLVNQNPNPVAFVGKNPAYFGNQLASGTEKPVQNVPLPKNGNVRLVLGSDTNANMNVNNEVEYIKTPTFFSLVNSSRKEPLSENRV